MTLRLATRRSPLARAQAELVRDRLAALGVAAELVVLDTAGDQRLDVALHEIGGQGVFAVEIQQALLDGRADVAVHSAKDLPSESPEGVSLVAVPERRDPADALVGRSLAGLGPGATVATGSPRRRALLLATRPDLNVVALRGNMATRLGRVGHDGIDAVVAATAALERLGQLDLVAERLDPEYFVPQVGQGALALEIRSGDDATRSLVAPLNSELDFLAVAAERAFLRELGAGCSVPVGAHATWRDGTLSLLGVMMRPDGSRVERYRAEDQIPDDLGRHVAVTLRDHRGGGSLVGEVGT